MKKLLWLLPIIGALLLLTQSCSTESTPIYQLTTSAEPAEAGSVSQSALQADGGETITITAEANEHWFFNGWGGDHTGSDNPASLVMDRDKSVTAMFQKRDYPLTINIVGEGQVHEKVLQSKTTDYPHGTLVELTAVPEEGWRFIGWSEDVEETNELLEITIESEKDITAHFNLQEPLIFSDGSGEVMEITISGVPITVEKIGEDLIFQGDMVVDPDYLEQSNNLNLKILDEYNLFWHKWPSNTIPYVFADHADNSFKNRAMDGMRLIEDYTNINFKPRESNGFYIEFIPVESGNHRATAGRNLFRKKHEIKINNSQNDQGYYAGTAGIFAHEILHTLGLPHEQSRYDRDDYVIIHKEHIKRDARRNFRKYSYSSDAPYDYLSILHYGSFYFQKAGLGYDKPTIERLDGVKFWAPNRSRLSDKDIKKINELYPTIRRPYVTTSEISSIASSSALSGGIVEDDGGTTVTTRGVCWSTTQSPDLNDDCTIDGAGTGQFTSNLTGLNANTKYYVRAYATNETGTAYGNSISFSTKTLSALDEWLNKHKKIRNAIYWESINGLVNYSDWSISMKNQLYEYYENIRAGRNVVTNYPPKNLYTPKNPDSERPRTLISEEDAWNLYLANIANSLVMEKENKLGWSLLSDDFSSTDLAIIFNSTNFYYGRKINNEVINYEIVGWVLPAPPNYSKNFLTKNYIIQQNRLEAIYRIIDWSAVHLIHYIGGATFSNLYDVWHYPGGIPVTKIIEGTRSNQDIPNYLKNRRHWTGGCWGTTYFYRAILRTINIPVSYERTAGHYQPSFPVDGLYLGHGDDPYNAYFAFPPAIHPKKLLINKKTYNEWYGNNISNEQKERNLPRRTLELAVEYTSNHMLYQYCDDKLYYKIESKYDSQVYKNLSRIYSNQEIDDLKVWESIQEKIKSIGGCNNDLPFYGVSRERIPYY